MQPLDNVTLAHRFCAFNCGTALTGHNSTSEHILLNAIGGRKKVSGFICTSCNSRTGAAWDAELARQLNPLSLLLGISRQRGEVPTQTFSTVSGEQFLLHPNGKRTVAKPSYEVTSDGENTKIYIRARTMRELRTLVAGMRRKYRALQRKSLQDLMSTAKPVARYSSDWIAFNLNFGGGEAGRSLVKSAVALTYSAGVAPSECDTALDYLLDSDAEACFGYFYPNDRDLVTNRPTAKPFHCVSVTGAADTGRIIGYIELYSLHRIVLCLSEKYLGKPFKLVYAVDPVGGQEIDMDVDLDLSISDIRSAYEYGKCDEQVMKSAVEGLLEYVVDAGVLR